MLVVKYQENWATDHRQIWHAEALQMLGERIVFRHRWNIQDFSVGRVQRCTVCSASQHVNENQRVRVLGATGGTFKLIFNDEVTADIPFDQTAAGLKDALLQLDSIESEEDIITVGDAVNLNDGVILEFRGNWAFRSDVPMLEADYTNLLGGGSVEIIQTQAGMGGEEQRWDAIETYKQSGNTWCMNCFGVGFNGGFEPIIYVTYALISDQQAETTRSQSGVMQRADPQVQFSYEPAVQEFDIIARVFNWEDDGITPREVSGRFILKECRPETLRTGPGTTDDSLSFAPPQFKDIYKIPDSHLVIGQTSQLQIVPYENIINYVPLTPYEEEVVAELGIDRRRVWHDRPTAPLNTNPIKGI